MNPSPTSTVSRRSRRHSLSWLALASTALGLVGCIEIDQNVVLNPDGSGKISMSTAIAMPDLGGLSGIDGAKPDPKAQARELAVGMLRSEGIETWTDVKYDIGKDGKTRASATGYFPDVTKVLLNKQMGEGVDTQPIGISRNAAGNWALEAADLFASKKKAGAGDEGKAPAKAGEDEAKAPPLSDDEVEAKLTQERQQWAAMKGFMGAFLQGIKARLSIQGGGSIVESTVFKKESDSKASLEITGQQMLDVIDKILQDDEKAKKLIRAGKSPTGGGEDSPAEFFDAAFGSDKPRVVIKPGAPAFDYAAEVAKAKSTQTPELKALLADAKKPPKSGGGLKLGTGSDPEPDGGASKAEEDAAAPKKKPGKSIRID